MSRGTESNNQYGDALITGASSGIGAALAEEFARRGHRVILVSRREDRLETVADRIESETGRRPIVLPVDLAKPGAGKEVAAALSERQLKPAYIVNSAGFGLLGLAGKLDIEDQLAAIDVNCRALVEVTLSLLPMTIEQRGGIINVGSVGGFFPGPGMAVYFATKAFVQSFSQALREEYRERGLRVLALCPGPVPTGFQARAGMVSPKIPRLLRREVDEVAVAGYDGLMRNRAVVVPGFLNLLMVAAGGLIFHRSFASWVRGFHLRRPNRELQPDATAPAPQRNVVAGRLPAGNPEWRGGPAE